MSTLDDILKVSKLSKRPHVAERNKIMAKTINSKKIQECLNGEGSEGLSLRLSNRWVNVYVAIEPNADGDFVDVYHLHAGEKMLPTDYTETHDTIESLVASMRELRDLRSWQPSSVYYTE